MTWRGLCALAALGCSGPATDAGGRATAPLEPTTRDSAGVTIHEHAADALERAPLLVMDSVPLAVFVGDVEDPLRDISTIGWLQFTESGDLVGYERTESQFVVLRVAEGTQQRHGRRGAGPGEIGNASNMTPLLGDTVVFVDQRNDRLTIAHPDTGIIRTISRSEVAGLRNAQLLTRLGDSIFLFAGHERGMGSGGPPESGVVEGRRSLMLWHIGRDSARTLAQLPGDKMFQTVFPGGGPGSWTMIGHGIALAGSVLLDAWDGRFVFGGGGTWQVERRDTTGRLHSVIRVARPPQMVNEALVSRSVEAELATSVRYDSTLNVDSARAAIRARPHADTVGVFRGMQPTPQGRLWLLDYPLPGDSGWAATLLDGGGRILGRIIDSTGTRPHAFGNDRLAFRTEDEDGIATITVRRIRVPQ